MRAILVLLASAALLAGCTAQQPADCDIGDPDGLGRCIKQLLINSRGKIAKEADPLHLPDHNDGDLRANNIVVRGISSYSVDHLSVSFPREQQIAVRAAISWPGIRGDLDVKVRKCKRIIWKICASARASPDVKVGRTVGTLTTTLNVNVAPDGQLTVTATGTNVALNLASIKVKANVRGLIGAVNRIIGDPASRITTKIANKWWNNNRGKIEGKARSALDKAVREELAVHLGRLLKL